MGQKWHPPMIWKKCDIDNCDRRARTPRSKLCHMHYSRIRNHGTPGASESSTIKNKGERCVVAECPSEAETKGMCGKHYTRHLRHGDPKTTYPNRLMPGTGTISYRYAHALVRVAKGSASDYRCVDCDGEADHWSYNLQDPDEVYETSSGGVVRQYSEHVEFYEPRCSRCHMRFDEGLD